MKPEPFKNPCHRRRRDFRKMFTDIFPLHTKGHVFPSADGFQDGQIAGIKKVKPTVRTFLLLLRAADFIQLLLSAAVVIKRRNKFKIAEVRRFQDCEQMVQAVDTLFQRRFLNAGSSIFVLNFTLHTECADVIAGTFNPQDTAEFIIHFNGYITYMVLDSRFEDTLVVVGTNFFLIVIGNVLSREVAMLSSFTVKIAV